MTQAHSVTPLRQRMLDDMKLRNMAVSTRKIYVSSVAGFSAYHGRSPDELTLEDVRDYQLHLVARGLKASSICPIMSALRFFYGTTLRRVRFSSSGAKRWTQRYMVVWSTSTPRSASMRSRSR